MSEREKLRDWLDGLSTVNVEYAPAHGAPYFSKMLVMPGVEAFVDRIEQQAVDAFLASPEFERRLAAALTQAILSVPAQDYRSFTAGEMGNVLSHGALVILREQKP